MRSIWQKDKARRVRAKHQENLWKKWKARSVDMRLSAEDRRNAMEKLRTLNKFSSHTKMKRRCVKTGSRRSVNRTFGLARGPFRDLARAGKLPVMKVLLVML